MGDMPVRAPVGDEPDVRQPSRITMNKYTSTTVEGSKLATLLANVTVGVIGDSMNVQLGIAFACRMLQHVPMTEHHLEWHCSKTKRTCDPTAADACPGGGGHCRYGTGCGYFANSLRLCVCQANDPSHMKAYCINHRTNMSRVGPLYDDADHRRVLVYGTIAVHSSQQALQQDGTLLPLYSDWRERARQEVELVLSTFATNRKYAGRHPLLVWRSATPQHFDSPGGRFVAKGKERYGTVANDTSVYGCVKRSEEALRTRGGPDWNEVALPLLREAGIPVIDAWSSAAVAWRDHIGVHDFDRMLDCTHFCHTAGVTSNWSLQLERILLTALENRAHMAQLWQTGTGHSVPLRKAAPPALSLPAGALPSLVKNPGICSDPTTRVGDGGRAWHNNSLERLAPRLYYSSDYIPVQHRYKNTSVEHELLWMYANGAREPAPLGWSNLWYKAGRMIAFADLYSALVYTALTNWPHQPPIGHFSTGITAIKALRDLLSPHFETLAFLHHVDSINACPRHAANGSCCSRSRGGSKVYTEIVALRSWAFGKCPGHENLSLAPPHPCDCQSGGSDPREFC